MDSDPISEATPKRRKTESGYQSVPRTWDSDNDSGDELFNEFDQQNTVATLPLQSSSRDPPTQLKRPGAGTQPTQILGTPKKHLNPLSSPPPSVQVARSSPPAASSPTSSLPAEPALKPKPQQNGRPGGLLASVMAPPGTAFRRPVGVQKKPPVIDLSDDDDAPIEHSSDEDTQPMKSTIRPTEFTRGGRGLNSSPNWVEDSPRQQNSQERFKSITSQFKYGQSANISSANNPSDDMASAYGGVSRTKQKVPSRQAGPARAQPVDMTIDDLTDLDVRKKVERILLITPGKPIQQMLDALAKKHGNADDAIEYLLNEDDKHLQQLLSSKMGKPQQHIDLTLASSDIEKGVAKPAARPVAKVPPPRPMAKQEVKAPTRTIQEKYSSTQRLSIPKPAAVSQPEPPKRKRLMQGRKNPSISLDDSSPEKPTVINRSVKKPVVIESDSEDEPAAIMTDDEEEAEEYNSDFEGRLLKFFNTCSVQDLADVAATPATNAELIVSKRPFRNLDAVRAVSDAKPNAKTGRKSTKKAIGEKIVDICEEMFTGYEAVDDLVAKCEALGKPIAETMKKWGLDLQEAARSGELNLTTLEETQDSGIGTPSSSVNFGDDDDIKPVSTKSGKSAFLKQPSIMSTDLQMKDYQLVGLNWLNLLWTKRLSCILADDMGLGKTCQVISFLAHLRETGVPGVHLVVVPGSTLENWLREFNRFCPALRVEPYYGSQATREEMRYSIEEDLDDIDVIVTTYETAANNRVDTKFLSKLRPTVCVFDEGHALKNSKSNRHQALMRIPATFRLLLSGTPLQNNLQELVSLLSFILPQLFEERKDHLEYIFKHKASTKDADHSALLSAQRIARARSMMTPFILRRKKAQVLKHMPAKHTRVEYCEMTPSQADYYNSQVAEAIAEREQQQSSGIKAKAGSTSGTLMALRFAAIHPLLSRYRYTDKVLRKIQTALMTDDEFGSNRPDQVWKYLTEDLKGGDFALHKFCWERSSFLGKYMLKDSEWMDSGKVQVLKKLLEAYIANGDKILVFSQFTTMMNILEWVLETLGIKFMRLDGSTEMARRQDIIDQFSTDESIPVFMLSTKAGGAGINLACANKVVIFDSSFNPQEDVQAENRAHRVGQTREVEVVRLVTRGTIEEQIHMLGESKLALDSRVAGEGGDEKKAEAEGEKMVEKLFFDGLEKGKEGKDAKEQFKDGLKGAGLDVRDD